MTGQFTAAEYAGAMRALLPRGPAWNIEAGSTQAALCAAFTQIVGQSDADAIQIIADAFPETASAMLPEWNETLGIPDACFGPPASVTQNRQQIVAKLIGTGGQSIAYFVGLAAAFGIDITISEFSALYTDTAIPAGMILAPADWAYTWRVNIDRNSVPFISVASPVNAFLASQNLQALDCLLRRYKPAHTQFYYALFISTPTRLIRVTDTVGSPLNIVI
jgi:uncharacterized protein YmfQ (DUF2313 family)